MITFLICLSAVAVFIVGMIVAELTDCINEHGQHPTWDEQNKK